MTISVYIFDHNGTHVSAIDVADEQPRKPVPWVIRNAHKGDSANSDSTDVLEYGKTADVR